MLQSGFPLRFQTLFLTAAAALVAVGTAASGQSIDLFSIARSHPAIAYTSRPLHDPVAALIARVERGEQRLAFDPQRGYLPAVLEALKIHEDSQVLVFSKTSFQAAKINPQNPRALYFNDAVSVGWVRGAEYLEFAAQDPEQGAIFYTLVRSEAGTPTFTRDYSCLACHISESTMQVPGMFAGSLYPNPTGMPMYAPVYYTDHRSRFEQRWGGWYVTGQHGTARHIGNGVVTDPLNLLSISTAANQNLRSLAARFDATGYASGHSDIVALMALEHQMHLANLLTRVAWEARIDSPEGRAIVESRNTPSAREPGSGAVIEATRPAPRAMAGLRSRPLRDAVVEIVDYMLFVDEVAFEGPVEGTSGFTQRFSAEGPRDSKGRSFRQFDLERRLLRYPCSYMIYSAQFEALPAVVRQAIYERIGVVLTGGDPDPIYQKLTPADRTAIIEILRETKTDLPAQFGER